MKDEEEEKNSLYYIQVSNFLLRSLAPLCYTEVVPLAHFDIG